MNDSSDDDEGFLQNLLSSESNIEPPEYLDRSPYPPFSEKFEFSSDISETQESSLESTESADKNLCPFSEISRQIVESGIQSTKSEDRISNLFSETYEFSRQFTDTPPNDQESENDSEDLLQNPLDEVLPAEIDKIKTEPTDSDVKICENTEEKTKKKGKVLQSSSDEDLSLKSNSEKKSNSNKSTKSFKKSGNQKKSIFLIVDAFRRVLPWKFT